MLAHFAPPTILHAHINATVKCNFHAAGAGCLPWTAGIIEPEIHTLGEMRPLPHIIVFQVYQTETTFISLGSVNNILNYFLASLILGVSFAGKNKLYPVAGKVQQPLHISEEQGSSLVSRRPAGETYG